MHAIEEESQTEYAKNTSYIGSQRTESFLPPDHSRRGRSLSAEHRRKYVMQSQSSADYALTKSTPFSAVKLSERGAGATDGKRSSYNKPNPLTLPWINKLAKIDAGTNDSYIITE